MSHVRGIQHTSAGRPPTPEQIKALQARMRSRGQLPPETTPTTPPAGDPVADAIAALESGDFKTALQLVTQLAGAGDTPEVRARAVSLGLSAHATALCARNGIDPRKFYEMRAKMTGKPVAKTETEQRIERLEANSRTMRHGVSRRIA